MAARVCQEKAVVKLRMLAIQTQSKSVQTLPHISFSLPGIPSQNFPTFWFSGEFVLLNQFLLPKDLLGKFQLPRLQNIAQSPRLLVRQQPPAFVNLNHKR